MILSVIFFLADHTEEMSLVYFKGCDFRLTFDFEFDFFEILLMIIQPASAVIFGISYTLTAHILNHLDKIILISRINHNIQNSQQKLKLFDLFMCMKLLY
jgi:hypothetical protein